MPDHMSKWNEIYDNTVVEWNSYLNATNYLQLKYQYSILLKNLTIEYLQMQKEATRFKKELPLSVKGYIFNQIF